MSDELSIDTKTEYSDFARDGHLDELYTNAGAVSDGDDQLNRVRGQDGPERQQGVDDSQAAGSLQDPEEHRCRVVLLTIRHRERPLSFDRGNVVHIALFIALASCCFLMAGCGGRAYLHGSVNDVDIRGHSETQSDGPVRVSASVLGREETEEIFGLALYDQGNTACLA